MNFCTFRRHYLDAMLAGTSFSGAVIDVGGKKAGRRGAFAPPLHQVRLWHSVNLDPAARPDFCCDATRIPVPDGSYDMALLCEVLEHLPSPGAVLSETCRILRPGGTLVLSAPFLFAMHPDPADYQRWTPDKLREGLKAAGFKVVHLGNMGSLGAVVYDLAASIWSSSRWRYVLVLLRPVALLLERLQVGEPTKVTTGYFVVAHKLSDQRGTNLSTEEVGAPI